MNISIKKITLVAVFAALGFTASAQKYQVVDKIVAVGLVAMGGLSILGYIAHIVTTGNSNGTEIPMAIVSGLTGYMRREQALRSHAKDLGLSVGLMDWAIWIVMRVAKNTIAEPSRA